jgi:chromosome segregation ATPase
MEGLRAERDEAKAYQKKAGKTGQRQSAAQAGRAPSQPPKSKGNGLMASSVLITLVLLSGFLSWSVFNQQQTISQLELELADTVNFITASKLLMARFEGELSDTGAEVAQSGSSATKKLAFLDSEMRKLWGVAGDRNKKAIAENKQIASELLSAMTELTKEQAGFASQMKVGNKKLLDIGVSVAALDTASKSLLEDAKKLGVQVSNNTGDMAITRQVLDDELILIKEIVSTSPPELQGLQADMAENKLAIASIDANRGQLNARIVSLEKSINALKRELSENALP